MSAKKVEFVLLDLLYKFVYGKIKKVNLPI